MVGCRTKSEQKHQSMKENGHPKCPTNKTKLHVYFCKLILIRPSCNLLSLPDALKLVLTYPSIEKCSMQDNLLLGHFVRPKPSV